MVLGLDNEKKGATSSLSDLSRAQTQTSLPRISDREAALICRFVIDTSICGAI